MSPADPAWWIPVVLVGMAFCAGWVDAVVGGGGLIQLPALLIGLPDSVGFATISGTNKVSSVAGTSMAALTYLRRIKVQLLTAVVLVVAAALGSAVGASVVPYLPKKMFSPLVFVVMIVIGIYTYRRPELGLRDHVRLRGGAALAATALIGLGVGLWDGLVGPGTGTFFIILFVTVLGRGFLAASAYAKLANLTTNIAAISVFALHGQILWWLALPMAAANLIGGFLGARLALKHGNRFVRRVFLIVVAVLSLRMGWESVTGLLELSAGR